MSFTEEQIEALEMMEEVFGPTEINAQSVKVSRLPDYEYAATAYLKYALDGFACYKLASEPEFAIAQEVARQEEERKRAEKQAARAGEVREATVMGMMTGLVPKASKAAGEVMFDITDKHLLLTVWRGVDRIVLMAYDKETLVLETNVAGEIFSENMWRISGNSRPREQSKGLDAVHVYLDGLAGNGDS
jgi:hypothetical protein